MSDNYLNKSPYAIVLLIWAKLRKRRKIQIFLNLLVMAISGLAEMINLSVIVPFLIILTDPKKIWDLPLINEFSNFLNITNQDDLVIPITMLFAMTALFSGSIRVLNLFLNIKLTSAIGNDFSLEIYKRKLFQPYIMHVQENSSEAINSIVNNINSVIVVIERTLALLTSFIVMLNIFFGLIIFNPNITLAVTILLIGFYLSITYFTKINLFLNSKTLAFNQQKQIKIIQESLGSIKDIFIFKSKNIYLENYSKADKYIRKSSAQNVFLKSSPRYIIETLAIVIITIGSIFLRKENEFNEEILIVLGVFALAFQKLLPNMQQIYIGLSSIRANSQQSLNLLRILNKKLLYSNHLNISETIEFKKNIKLKAISFKYSSKEDLILKDINLIVNKGDSIGIKGTTGSGKTTLIDIILGFLVPFKGNLEVDGINIYDQNHPERITKWQNTISYVPQDIFLLDGTIKENIAYGIPKELIDFNFVKKSAKFAKIDDFVKSNPLNYDTYVGERGIKLSGGQIQRIGIARALYKNAQVFIFDEATSALDYKTELEIINSIKTFNKEATIIMIAHRLNSLRCCDKVIDIELGRIKNVISGKDIDKI